MTVWFDKKPPPDISWSKKTDRKPYRIQIRGIIPHAFLHYFCMVL